MPNPITDFVGVDGLSDQQAARMVAPIGRVESVNANTADATPETVSNCRHIYADVEGIAKITCTDPSNGESYNEVLIIGPTGKNRRNVTKVWKEYKSSTDSTAKIYDTDGSLVIGLKLGR